MRNSIKAATIVLGWGLALAARAQDQPRAFSPWGSASSFLSGVNAGDQIFKPIDTSNLVAPVPSAFKPKTSFKNLIASLNPVRLFSKNINPGFLPSPTAPPAPSSSVPVAENAGPFQPVAPIISSFLPITPDQSPFQPVAPRTQSH